MQLPRFDRREHLDRSPTGAQSVPLPRPRPKGRRQGRTPTLLERGLKRLARDKAERRGTEAANKRMAEIETMMWRKDGRYWLDEDIQQEYRDLIDQRARRRAPQRRPIRSE